MMSRSQGVIRDVEELLAERDSEFTEVYIASTHSAEMAFLYWHFVFQTSSEVGRLKLGVPVLWSCPSINSHRLVLSQRRRVRESDADQLYKAATRAVSNL